MHFTEEALELSQVGGVTKDQAHALVDYVYGRPVGGLINEVGGVLNTLAGVYTFQGIDMMQAGKDEAQRCLDNIDKIRHKSNIKPKF